MQARQLEFDKDQQFALLYADEKASRAAAVEEEMACDENIDLSFKEEKACEASDFEEERACDDWMQDTYDAQTCKFSGRI